MEKELDTYNNSGDRPQRKSKTSPSSDKALRTILLAILFQVSWPERLSKQQIVDYLPLYGDHPTKALYRDIKTLTDIPVEYLPAPDAQNLADWCVQQQQLRRLALTYDRHDGPTGTFGLAQSIFSIEIGDDEARAFVALQEGFGPGIPYAEAVQHLLKRWEWLFSQKSRRLVQQKRRRRARPLLLPLSPVEDYSQHGETILSLDRALEHGVYISFAYTPLAQSWDAQPVHHERAEPYELEYREGHWYFTAYLPDLNNFVDYRVNRIRPGSILLANDHFLPGNRRRPGVKIRYWVSPMLARHGSLSARLREQQVTLLEDDQGAVVEGYAKSLWWARRLLLGYGEQVKALEPEELVVMMRTAAEAMSRLYGEER